MAHKTITLNDEAYRRLKQGKRKGESFSEVVIRTMRERGNTAGEILDLSERDPPPRFDETLMRQVIQGCKRRSRR